MKNSPRSNIINANVVFNTYIEIENKQPYIIVFNNKELCKVNGLLYYDIQDCKKIFISNEYITEYNDYMVVNQINIFANRLKYTNCDIKFINIHDILNELFNKYFDIDILFYDTYVKLLYRHRSYIDHYNVFEILRYTKLNNLKSKLIEFSEAIEKFDDNVVNINDLINVHVPSLTKEYSYLHKLDYNDVATCNKIIEDDIIFNTPLNEINEFKKMINSLLKIHYENRFHKYDYRVPGEEKKELHSIVKQFIDKGIIYKRCKIYGTTKERGIKITYGNLIDNMISDYYPRDEYIQFVISYMKAEDIYDEIKNRINTIILHYF